MTMLSYREITDSVWQNELAFSDIPESLHGKVRAQVRMVRYFRCGTFDIPEFRKAVEAEVKEWDRLFTPHVLGLGSRGNKGGSYEK